MIKDKLKKILTSLLMATMPILLILILLLMPSLLLKAGFAYVADKIHAAGGYFFGHITEDSSEETALLDALNDGTVTDANLNDLSITREDLKKILNAVIEANSDKVNEITYEVQEEQWERHEEVDYSVTNSDGSHPNKWVYEWKKHNYYETKEYHSKDIEAKFRVYWTDIYSMYRIGAMNDDDVDALKGNWSEEIAEDNSIVKVKSRIDDEKLDKIINMFKYTFEYKFDAARSNTGLIVKGKKVSYGEMEKYCYEYVDSDMEHLGASDDGSGTPHHLTGNKSYWPWNTDGTSYENPPEEEGYLGTKRYRKKIPISVVDKIYTKYGLEKATTNYMPYKHYEMGGSLGGHKSTLGTDKIDSVKVDYVDDLKDPAWFVASASEISTAFTFDYFYDMVMIATGDTYETAEEQSESFKKWESFFDIWKQFERGEIESTLQHVKYEDDSYAAFGCKKAIVGSGCGSHETAPPPEEEEGGGDWDIPETSPVDPSDAENYIWNVLSARYGRAGAAGIIGNLKHESGLNPNALNSIGAYGLAQWLGGRKTDLKSFAAKNHMAYNTIEAQVAFIIHEIDTTSQFMSVGSKVYNSYLAKNPTMKSYGFSPADVSKSTFMSVGKSGDEINAIKCTLAIFMGYERPGDNTVKSRITYALQTLRSH